MSREAPRFGEVFRWKSETQDSLIMYVAPCSSRVPTSYSLGDDWWGVSLDENDIHLAGDMDKRVSLMYPRWSEVSE